MKSIKELLPEKTVDILIQMCRTYNLKGYGSLRKDGLINLIIENLNNPQFKETIQSLIPHNGTTALILKSFIDSKNEIGYSKLREEVLKNRSSSAFRHYYQELMTNFMLFENESSEDDILFLPKEFIKFAEKVIEKKLEEETPEDKVEILSKEEEEKEKKEINTIDRLLYSKKYTDVETLRNILKRLGKSSSGNKSQLIERLLYNSEKKIEDIIDKVLFKNDLRDICLDFDLLVSGNKEELVKRVLKKFPPALPKKVFKEKPRPKEKKAKGMASDVIKKEKKILPPKPKIPKLKQQIKKLLEELSLFISKINKNNLEIAVIQAIQQCIDREETFKDINIKVGGKYGPTILAERHGKTVAISVCYIQKSPKGEINNIKIKIFDYRETYGNNLIFYIYDSTGKVNTSEIEKLQKNAEVIFRQKKYFSSSD